jgi:hypothetical protein
MSSTDIAIVFAPFAVLWCVMLVAFALGQRSN